jgi:hypothetical protein
MPSIQTREAYDEAMECLDGAFTADWDHPMFELLELVMEYEDHHWPM